MAHLRKLIVVDSYAASRIREVRLDGHVHVAGRNGRGKTTLIRLIPLFYGEQPSKVVKSAGSVVRSLREFMFARSTSYVVFEYENHDGIKLAILHYGADNSPQYHLADGPYERGLFVDNDQFVEGRHLNARLRTLGRNPSGALGVLQYRAVVQGNGARLAAAEHRALTRRFALVAQRSRLAGIERIASGMFSKDITFVALKRMAASVAYDEDEKQIVLSLTRKELESFLPDFRAYRTVMALEPDFEAANTAYGLGNVARRRQSVAAGKLKRLVLALGRHLETARLKAYAEEETLATLKREQAEAAADFDLKARAIETDIARLDAEIEQANREERAWAEQDIQAQAVLVERRPELEARVGDLKERQARLTERAESVSRKYQALFAEERNRRAQAENEAQTRLNRLIGDSNGELEALADERESALAALEEAQRADAEAADTAWRAAVAAVSAIDEGLARLVADPELDCLVHDASVALETANAEVKQAMETESVARLDAGKQENALALQVQAVAAQAMKLEQAHRQLAHLLLLENPGADTLLHYLRANRPDWHGDIAKVVREDLLLRTDLAPADTDEEAGRDSLYGLLLDLPRITAGRAAGEQALADEIARARAHEAESDAAHKAAERQRQALAKAVDAARESLREAGAERARRENALEQGRQALAAARKRRDEELGERRGALQAQRLEAASVERSRKQAAETLAWTHRHAKDNLRAGFDSRAAALKQQQQEAIRRHAEEVAQIHAARRRAIEGLDKLRLSELGQAGVDTAALTLLETELHDAETLAQRARDCAPAVESWRRWLAQTPARREANTRARQQRLAEVEALQRRRDEALARLAARIDNQQAVVDQAKVDLATLNERLRQAETAQQARLAGIDAETAEVDDALAVHWLLADILTDLDAATGQLREQDKRLRTLLGNLARSFRKPEYTATKVGEFAGHLSDDYWSDPRQALDVFADWYGTAHAQHRDVLAGTIQNGGGILRRFHDGLVEFQSSINGLSRELQNSLETDMVFEAIRRLSLRLSALVERRPYWDALNRVLAEFERWRETGYADLPGEALLEEMQDFARHLPEGKLEEAPDTLMDLEIEVDDGTDVKRVRNESDLKQVSSNGLSYLVLCLIFVAFANRARRHADDLWLTWALDEIGTIDEGNSKALLTMLDRNRIRLVSASPEAKEALQALFDHRYEVLPEFEIRRILGEDELPSPASGGGAGGEGEEIQPASIVAETNHEH